MHSKRKTLEEEVKTLMKGTVKAFHLALFHSKNSIGAGCLHGYHHKVREKLRECAKNLDGKENALKRQIMQFHDLVKLCYESFSKGDPTAAKTYLYHMESACESFGKEGYYLKLPI